MAMNAPQYSLPTRLLLGCYSSIKSTGLLELPIAKRGFVESYFIYKRLLEDPFYKFSRRHPELFEGGAVLDVGANCGYTALVFAKTKATHVYAFEPDRANVDMLTQVLRSRNLERRVTVVQSAVGAEDGFVDLWFNAAHHADHRIATTTFKETREDLNGSMERVPLVALDTFVQALEGNREVSFIKVDVQGFELPVCRGMAGLLDRFPAITCALEYCPAQIEELGFSASDVLAFFTDRGFRVFMLQKTGTLAILDESALAHAISGRGYVDILATRRDIVLP
jgi:FkbM family methyltransferase